MINAYVLEGIEEYILVFKSCDPEDIRLVIEQLCSSKSKRMRELGALLEKELDDRHRDNVSKNRPEDKSKVHDRSRSNARKTVNPKHRPKSGA